MATEFGSRATEAPEIPSFVTAKEGVGKPDAFAGVNKIFEDATSLLSSNKESKGDVAIANLVQRQTLVADALAQGKITNTAHARMLTRKNFLEALNANPTLWKELAAAHSSVVSTVGIGAIIDEGSKLEQRREAEADRLVSGGMLAPDHTTEQFDEASLKRRTAAQALEGYQETIRQMDLKLKDNTLTASDRTRLENSRKDVSRNTMVAAAPAFQDSMVGSLDNILKGNGTDAEKILAMDDVYTAFLSQTSALFGDLAVNEANYVMMPFERIYNSYKAQAAGELTAAETIRDLEEAKIQSEALAMADPVMARLATVKKVLGDNGVIQALSSGNPDVMKAVTNFVGGYSSDNSGKLPSPYGNSSTEKKSWEAYSKGQLNMLSSSDPEEVAEAIDTLPNVLESMLRHVGEITDDPEAAFAVVDWFASPKFLEAINAHPEVFAPFQSRIDTMLKTHYSDEVWGLVGREFSNKKVVDPSIIEAQQMGTARAGSETSAVPSNPTINLDQVVSYRTTTSGMEFYSINPDDDLSVSNAKVLNDLLKPRINSTIKANAHLNGRSDYGKIWEDTAQQFMRGELSASTGTDEVGGGAVNDDLGLTDLKNKGVAPVVNNHTNANVIISSLKGELNLTNEQIAGVLGNIRVESGESFATSAVGDGGNALGVAQWNGDRKRALEKFAEDAGEPVDSIQLQAKFLIHELKTSESKALKKLREAKTPEEAAEIFSKWFERPRTPHLNRRKSAATKFFNSFGA